MVNIKHFQNKTSIKHPFLSEPSRHTVLPEESQSHMIVQIPTPGVKAPEDMHYVTTQLSPDDRRHFPLLGNEARKVQGFRPTSSLRSGKLYFYNTCVYLFYI